MRPSLPHAAAALLCTLLLAGCGITSKKQVSYDPEEFDSTTTHTRSFRASQAETLSLIHI